MDRATLADEHVSECHAPDGGGHHARPAWLLLGLLSALYLLSGKGFSEILDAEGYYLITKAIVEEGQVGIKPELSSAVLRGNEPTRDGRAFLHYGLGYPVVMVPFYVAGRAAGELAARVDPRFERFERFFPRAATGTALAFITALTAVALYYLLLQLGLTVHWAVVGALLFGLGTYAWPYSKIGFYEPFLSLCQMLALVWAVNYKVSLRAGWLVLAGFAAGWGIAAKPSLGLLLPPLVGYVWWAARGQDPAGRGRRVLVAAAGLAAGLLFWAGVMLWYNAARSGVVTDIGYGPGNYKPVIDIRHILTALYGNALSTGRGFFLYSPLTVLFVLGVGRMWRRNRAELAVMSALIVLNAGYFATRGNWATMRPWGPRYLVVLAPLLVALATVGIAWLWRRRAARWPIRAVVALSVCVQLLAIAMPFGTWLDRVKQETGTGFSAVLQPRYCPLWGQMVLLSGARLRPIEASGANIEHGEPTEQFKTELRQTPDFWFAYMYRLGLPPGLLLCGMAGLGALVVAFAVMLRRQLCPEGSAALGEQATGSA